MPKPIILISTGRTMLPTRGDDAQAVKVGMDADYADAVIRAGGVPLMLPPHGDQDAVRASVNLADGLLLTGGGDIHSLVYGDEPHPKSYDQDPARDATELIAVDVAFKRHLPILGISRGLQILNVARGGSLIQHIPSQGEPPVKHDSKGMAGLLLHSVDIEPNSILHGIFGVERMAVNSFHHQAADRLGQGLRVSARARDGVIEALESTDGSPVLGIQFHPEECADVYPEFDKVFAWLIRKARQMQS